MSTLFFCVSYNSKYLYNAMHRHVSVNSKSMPRMLTIILPCKSKLAANYSRAVVYAFMSHSASNCSMMGSTSVMTKSCPPGKTFQTTFSLPPSRGSPSRS